MTLRLTFSDIRPFKINIWRQELRMSEISQRGNEAENENPDLLERCCLEHCVTKADHLNLFGALCDKS